jgi:hypothetical protein
MQQKLQTSAELWQIGHNGDRNAMQTLKVLVDVPRSLFAVIHRLDGRLRRNCHINPC